MVSQARFLSWQCGKFKTYSGGLKHIDSEITGCIDNNIIHVNGKNWSIIVQLVTNIESM